MKKLLILGTLALVSGCLDRGAGTEVPVCDSSRAEEAWYECQGWLLDIHGDIKVHMPEGDTLLSDASFVGHMMRMIRLSPGSPSWVFEMDLEAAVNPFPAILSCRCLCDSSTGQLSVIEP